MIDNYHVSYNPCILLEKGIPLKTFMMKMVNPMDKIRYEIICLEILRQLCNVINYLSRNDIIHSDIRVEHIIIIGNKLLSNRLSLGKTSFLSGNVYIIVDMAMAGCKMTL